MPKDHAGRRKDLLRAGRSAVQEDAEFQSQALLVILNGLRSTPLTAAPARCFAGKHRRQPVAPSAAVAWVAEAWRCRWSELGRGASTPITLPAPRPQATQTAWDECIWQPRALRLRRSPSQCRNGTAQGSQADSRRTHIAFAPAEPCTWSRS